MRSIVLFTSTWVLAFCAPMLCNADSSSEGSGYQRPSRVLVEAIDRYDRLVPDPPGVGSGRYGNSLVSPDRKHLAVLSTRAYVPLAQMASDVWKTRNLNFSVDVITRRYSATGSFLARGLGLLELASGTLREVEFPADAALGTVAWSPDGRHLVVVVYRNAPGELWVVDATNAKARQLSNAIVNSLSYSAIQWVDSSTLLISRIANSTVRDRSSAVPLAPDTSEFIAQKTAGSYGSTSVRAAPYSIAEREMVLAFRDSELVMIDLHGKHHELGLRGAAVWASPSPNGRYLLVTQYHDPFFPAAEGTPARFAVYDRTGKHIQTIHDRLTPVAHGGLLDPDRVTPGPRQISWHPDHPARLQWFAQITDAATGADTGVDEIYALDQPFSGKPRRIYRSDHRIQDVFWLPHGSFLAYENRVGAGTSRLVRVVSSSDGTRVTKLVDYPEPPQGAVIPRLFPMNHPAPILKTNARGQAVPYLSPDGRYVYMAAADGSRLQRLSLTSGNTEPMTKAAGAFVHFLDENGKSALFLREESGTGGALVASDFLSGDETAVFRFPRRSLLPETMVAQVIQTQRADGLPLRATIHLPKGWSKSDGPLPSLLWVYALRYQSLEEYETELRRRASRPFAEERDFILDMRIMSLAGYAVVAFHPPVVPAKPGQSPYESGWNKQIVAGAQAIIDHLAAQGIVDPQRVAVGGQSGGGHTAASLVAHSNLFRAGIACNGLYNRTLSPFGVSLYEERSLWEVPQVYFEMSPLLYADKVSAPLLIMKGQEENHPTIHPAESANLYGALQGLGKTVRYVEFPFEEHTNTAYESVLHQLWEIERWLRLHLAEGGA